MKRLLLCCLAVLALAPARGDEARARHVFIVSFDQADPAGIEKAEMPVLKEMAREGAHTWEAFTIVPSLTLPSHTSMLTGVGIQKHQIDWNDHEPARGTVKVPTVFSLAKDAGLTTAMFVTKEKFRHLVRPGSLDLFEYPQEATALSAARAFSEKLAGLKPNLCFVHFADPDVKGHEFGVFSPEKMQAFADSDAALKILRDSVAAAGLADSSVFIVTSDHGSHDVLDSQGITRGTHGSSSPEDVTIPWIAWGKGVKKQSTITRPVVQYDTAATALWLLGLPIPEHFWGRPVTSAFE